MPPTPNSPLRIAAIICAAGSGTRFGTSSGSKLDQDIHGKPVLTRAIEAIASQPEVVATLVAGPADPDALAVFREHHEQHLRAMGATICPGGIAERHETVKASLETVRATLTGVDAVLIHDAARPCAPQPVIRRVIDALETHAAVVPAVPVPDTLKRAKPDANGSSHRVERTLDRRGLFACQTPQGFETDLIFRAYAQDDLTSTDDAQLVERLGKPVLLVAGDPRNLKITRPEDLEMARAIWPTLGH